ncbi:MAG: cell division protein FtsA [Patescibacteria group bacterium]
MMRNISIGIDMGSSTTRVVVGEFLKGEKNPKIIGVGEAETKGVRHGYVVNFNDAVNSVKNAVSMAEKSSGGIKIKKAVVSINSITLRSEINSGSTTITKANNEVTNLDIKKAIEESENTLNLVNRKIIQMFPVSFKLDGKEVHGKAEGMHGNKLEVKILFITCSTQHLDDLLAILAETGIETVDVTASSIAGSYLALTEKQKIVGSALVNIGFETVSLCIFENGIPVYLHTFSIGSSDITNDIALGFKIPLENAESLKIKNDAEKSIKKKLDEMIEARLSDIFELIENHLKKIKRNELLPAGVVFIGGGASIPKLEELSKSFLKLPSKIATTEFFGNIKTKLRDPAWFVVLGLVISSKNSQDNSTDSLHNIFKDTKNSIKSILKQLMP